MLRDLAPSETAPAIKLIEEPTADQTDSFYVAACSHGFAFALDAAAPAPSEEEDEPQQSMSLLDVAEAAEKQDRFSVGGCAESGTALLLPLTSELCTLFQDKAVPKQTHDWKSALHLLTAQGVELHGAPALREVVDDTMLLSYALNPTHSTQSLADVAARHSQPAPSTLAACAAAIHALVPALKAEVEKAGVKRVYAEIDLPLAPVLFRMEQAGVRIDLGVLDGLSRRFAIELTRVGERIFSLSGRRFNINSPKQLGEVLFTHLGLPAPSSRGKGKAVSTA